MLLHVQFLGLELVIGPVEAPKEGVLDRIHPIIVAALPVVMNLVREHFKPGPATADADEVLKALDTIEKLHKELIVDAETRYQEAKALEEAISALVARVDALENPGTASNGLDAESDPVYAAAEKSL